MTTSPHGLLLAMMEPPASLEEEFADWYDTEHVPERLRIPGFLSGLRFVCVQGWPRFVAVYDLSSAQVLDDEGYRAVSGVNFSPWSKRILARVRGQWRAAGTQVHPGHAVTGRCVSMTLMRFRGVSDAREPELVEAVRAAAAQMQAASLVRVFRCEDHGRVDHLTMIEWSVGANAVSGFTPPKTFRDELDLLNIYVPYWKHGHLPGVYS